jgi:prophage regulatory protein
MAHSFGCVCVMGIGSRLCFTWSPTDNPEQRETQVTKTPDRFLREPEVAAMTSLGRAQRWRLESRGEFPSRVKLGDRTVAWSLLEVQEWMRNRPRARSATAERGAREATNDPPLIAAESYELDRFARAERCNAIAEPASEPAE